MSNRAIKLAPPAAVAEEVPGLAYFSAAPANSPAAPAQRKAAPLPALDQMFAYYTAE